MRLEVTRRSNLATRALLVLGQGNADDRIKGAVLADRVGASTGFLAQAMAPLVTRGWVRSEPGPTGGYVLAVPLASISVLEVIEAVEGPTDASRCVLEGRPCGEAGTCALHQPWTRARDLLTAELSGTALSELDMDGHSANCDATEVASDKEGNPTMRKSTQAERKVAAR